MDIKEKIKLIIKIWGESTQVFKIYPGLKDSLDELIDDENAD